MTELEKVMTVANGASNFIKDNLGYIGAGVGGLAVGGLLGAVTSNKGSAPSKRKASTRKTRKRKYSRSTKRQRYTPYTARKRKDTSHRRIRHTKNGQPYIILASGKAKFIKKSSARSSRRRKGGKY